MNIRYLIIAKFISSFNFTFADDLINLNKMKNYRVGTCTSKESYFIVTPCYRPQIKCSKTYSKKRYSCLPSKSCNWSYLKEVLGKKGFKLELDQNNNILLFGPKKKSALILLKNNKEEFKGSRGINTLAIFPQDLGKQIIKVKDAQNNPKEINIKSLNKELKELFTTLDSTTSTCPPKGF